MLLTFWRAEFATECIAEPPGVLVAGGCLVAVAEVPGQVLGQVPDARSALFDPANTPRALNFSCG
jgi:hypothetical protein